MPTQPEQELENELVEQVVRLGYEQLVILDEAELIRNLRMQPV